MTEHPAARPGPWHGMPGSDLATTTHDHPHGAGQPAPAEVSSARRAAAWLGWHTIELGLLSGSVALATVVDGWFLALTAAIGGGWAAHELRIARLQRLLQAQRRLTTPATAPTTAGQERDHD
jgi:hypothetical protein